MLSRLLDGRALTVALAALLWVGLSTVAALILACAVGTLTTGIAFGALFVPLVGILLLRRWLPAFAHRPRLGIAETLMILFFLGFVARHALGVLTFDHGKAHTLFYYNYFDLQFHQTMIQNFAEGAPFWPDSPILAGTKLHYHFGLNLFSALFVKLGFPMQAVLQITMLGLGLLLLPTLYYFGGSWAIAAFIGSGGFAGYEFFVNWALDNYQGKVTFNNIATALWITQRGFHWAFPAGLYAFGSLRRRFLTREPCGHWLFEGILVAIMPLFQIYAFAIVCLFTAIWSLASRRVVDGIKFGLFVSPLALWLLYHLVGGARYSPTLFYHYGLGEHGIWLGLLQNYGIYPLFIVFLAHRLWSSGQRLAFWAVLLPSLLIHICCHLILFTPAPWDNNKIMGWMFLLSTPYWGLVVPTIANGVVRVLVTFFLLGTGLLTSFSTLFQYYPRYAMYDLRELSDVCALVKTTDPRAVFATAEEWAHPVNLCGRKVVMGNSFFIGTHGIDAVPYQRDLATLMNGEPGWKDVARKYGVEYLYWGPREQDQFSGSGRSWVPNADLVWSNAGTSIYRLNVGNQVLREGNRTGSHAGG